MTTHTDLREHDDEPLLGLPETLPAGESILWQGSPDFVTLARRVLHVNKVIAWFVVIGLWRTAAHWRTTGSVTLDQWWTPMLAMTIALCLLLSMAWFYSRTTVYTLTSRRVTMRFGLAVPITMNIPFTQIESADVRAFAGDRGNIAMKVRPGARISHLVLWPNVRPWQWFSPQPMLCCISDFAAASAKLNMAVHATHNTDHAHNADAVGYQEPFDNHVQEA